MRLLDTPVGHLLLFASERGLCRIAILGKDSTLEPTPAAGKAAGHAIDKATWQLEEYFSGSRQVFDLLLDLSGLGAFDRAVLLTTRSVPYGSTVTYGRLARQAGFPRSARAVGGAMQRNPLPIIIPCHRVVRSDGGTGGYSGGGPQVKQLLLALEGLQRPRLQGS